MASKRKGVLKRISAHLKIQRDYKKVIVTLVMQAASP